MTRFISLKNYFFNIIKMPVTRENSQTGAEEHRKYAGIKEFN